MDVTNIDPIGVVTTAFRSLKTEQAKLQALRILSSELESSEIKKFSRWIHERDTRCDILGELPLELVLLILGYVDLRTTFRCRRVSQRWAVILSLEILWKVYLKPWYSGKHLALHERQVLPLSTAIGEIAEYVDAFCTGRPFSSLTMFLDRPTSRDFSSQFRYCKSLLTWWDEYDAKIHLVDLKSGNHKSFVRTSTVYALSEKLIVFCSDSGTVKVIDHLTEFTYRFQLPHGNVRAVIVKGGAIAILHDAWVTTWDIETKKRCHFCVCEAAPTHFSRIEDGIYLTTEDLHVVHFEVFGRNKGEYVEIWLTRYALNGTPLTDEVCIPAPRDMHSKPTVSTTGLVGKDLEDLLKTIAYHELREDRRYRNTPSIIRDRFNNFAPACSWKDILYESRDITTFDVPNNPRLCTSVYDFRYNTAKTILCEPCEPMMRHKETESELNELHARRSLAGYLKGQPVAVMGDENFVVNISNDGIVLIHCFEKEANLANLANLRIGIDFRYAKWRPQH